MLLYRLRLDEREWEVVASSRWARWAARILTFLGMPRRFLGFPARPAGGVQGRGVQRVLFIENHDSFSWNVIDALPFSRPQIEVLRPAEARLALERAEGVDAVVMGPGPTDPLRAGLLDLVRAVESQGLPFLGVCLGHQALGLAFGAALVRSPPAHGQRATALFSEARCFGGYQGPMEVMRYHSLSLTDVSAPLQVVATLDDGTVMAIEHRSLPMAGVQFHPDSFGTPRGRELLRSFFAAAFRGKRRLWVHPKATAPALDSATETQTGERCEPLPVSTLLHRQDFALLGPGFAAHGAWTLLEELREDDTATPALWFAAAETSGRGARRLAGRARRVEPVFDVPALSLELRLDETGFLHGVEQIRERIAEGDVYQVNLTLRAHLKCRDGAVLLMRLCHRAVPRFAAWVRAVGIGELVCASPELLFETEGSRIHAEPMKGTAGPAQRQWLAESQKDVAELAMITDLLRDDLHRLCEPGSVRVRNERRLLELPYVVQAVADIEGHLRPEVVLRDVFSVLHPGGSVTGAPRAAALAVISSLEPTPRGAYCGALGLELPHRCRVALTIRTAQRLDEESWRYGVGSGITWNSQASAELEEVRLKLGALLG